MWLIHHVFENMMLKIKKHNNNENIHVNNNKIITLENVREKE